VTSNATGISAPFKRLSTHLSKRGNTQSMFWKTSSELRREWLSDATINFFAVSVSKDQVGLAENWVMSKFARDLLLNHNPCQITPEIPADLEFQLQALLTKSIG
jgi:hypothetical protein